MKEKQTNKKTPEHIKELREIRLKIPPLGCYLTVCSKISYTCGSTLSHQEFGAYVSILSTENQRRQA